MNCLVKLLVGNLFPGLIFSFSSFTGAKFVQIVISNSQHALWVVVRWWTISSGCVAHVNTEPTSKKSVLWTTAHYVMRQSDFWKYIHCTSSALLPEPSYSWSEVKCYPSCVLLIWRMMHHLLWREPALGVCYVIVDCMQTRASTKWLHFNTGSKKATLVWVRPGHWMFNYCTRRKDNLA